MLIANPTRFLRDALYELISEDPGCEVVGEVTDQGALSDAADRLNPDCVVVAVGDASEPVPVWGEVLAKHPEAKIVAMRPDSNLVEIYWRSGDRHVRHAFCSASREGILQALRYPVA